MNFLNRENLSDTVDRTAFSNRNGAAPLVMVVAGEASSDFHAAELIHSLQQIIPGVRVFGMGGTALRRVGVETIVDSEVSASVMGLTEVLGSSGKILRALKLLGKTARERKPDLTILVDYPDFNLALAPTLHRAGIPILYFISPQLWAWRRGRVHKMKRYVRKIAAIFPFEEEFYHRYGVDAEFVGNPLTEHFPVAHTRSEIRSSLSLDQQRPVVALLPGSRKAEISKLLPPMLDGAAELNRMRPEVCFVIPVAPGLKLESIREQVGNRDYIKVIAGRSRDILSAADAAIVASGTATVETALAQVPFVTVYKLSPFTYRIARLLVRGVQHFSMANLICGEKVVEELLQDEVNGARIAAELNRLLGDKVYSNSIREKLATVGKRLRLPNGEKAGHRAASIAAQLLQEQERADRVSAN